MSKAESLQRLARTAGLLYLVLIVFGMFSPIVLETLVVPGDAGGTTRGILGSLGLFRASLVGWIVIVIADIAISVVLYLMFEAIDRPLALTMAAFRAAYSTILGACLVKLFDGFVLLTDPATGGSPELQGSVAAALESFATGFRLALVIFGVHLILFGHLLWRSKYVPGGLAILISVAGIGYILDGMAGFFVPAHGAVASALLLTPALLGEVGLAGWLLLKGVRTDAPDI